MFGKKEEKKARFVILSEDGMGFISLNRVMDTETGVNYILALSANGIAITPLLDEYGEVMVGNEE